MYNSKNNETEENEMGRAYSTHGENRKRIGFLWESQKERDH
jgi:hypothetical protein